jgi:hypothetical protein
LAIHPASRKKMSSGIRRREHTLLSPPSYTARVETRDSVFLPAFRSIKCWNLEYEGGLFDEIAGRFQDTSIGGGPRLLMSLRRASRIGISPLLISRGERSEPFLSRRTSFCRTWSQWSYKKRCNATHEPKSKHSVSTTGSGTFGGAYSGQKAIYQIRGNTNRNLPQKRCNIVYVLGKKIVKRKHVWFLCPEKHIIS